MQYKVFIKIIETEFSKSEDKIHHIFTKHIKLSKNEYHSYNRTINSNELFLGDKIIMILEEIFGFILMIAVAYSLKTVPQAISEYRGIRETSTKEEYGTIPSEYKWMHGTDLKIFLLYIIIGLPILIFIIEQSMKLAGTVIPATIIILIIVILTRQYAKKKGLENQAIIDAMPDEEKYRNPEDMGIT